MKGIPTERIKAKLKLSHLLCILVKIAYVHTSDCWSFREDFFPSFSFFSHTLHTEFSFPSLHSSQSSSPLLLSSRFTPPLFLLFFFLRTNLPRISTQQEIKSYNKTWRKLSYQNCMRQPSRRKGVTRGGKSQRHSTPTVRSPTKISSYTTMHICRGPSSYPHTVQILHQH